MLKGGVWHLPVSRFMGIKQGTLDGLDTQSAVSEDRAGRSKRIYTRNRSEIEIIPASLALWQSVYPGEERRDGKVIMKC